MKNILKADGQSSRGVELLMWRCWSYYHDHLYCFLHPDSNIKNALRYILGVQVNVDLNINMCCVFFFNTSVFTQQKPSLSANVSDVPLTSRPEHAAYVSSSVNISFSCYLKATFLQLQPLHCFEHSHVGCGSGVITECLVQTWDKLNTWTVCAWMQNNE